MSFECRSCFKSFETSQGVAAHCKAKHSCFDCQICDGRVFKNGWDLEKHYESAHQTAYCIPCNKHFVSEAAKQQHVRASPAHHTTLQCNLCDERFRNEDALNQHQRDEHQSSCIQCMIKFKDESTLNQHLRDSLEHKQVIVSTDDTFCTICGRRFKEPIHLQQHDASPVHRDKNTPCFACPSRFKTTSGLAQHVEGDCRNLPLNRNHITAAVQSLDVGAKISLRSIEGSSHLNSPAHDKDEFVCPKCNTQFKLVSGLVQHLESASCGLSNIDDVERRVNMVKSRPQELEPAPQDSKHLANLVSLCILVCLWLAYA